MSAEPRSLLIVTTVWPGIRDGSGLALASSLRVWRQVFPEVQYLACLHMPGRTEAEACFPEVQFSSLELPRAPLLVRFLGSLLGRRPACAAQYGTRRARRDLRQVIAAFRQRGGTHLVFEHLTPAAFLELEPASFAGLRIGLRSHDVLTEAFALLRNEARGAQRWAWSWEVARMRRLESGTVRKVHRFWTITGDDADEYARIFDRVPDGVWGVDIDLDRLHGIPSGDPNVALHLGGGDARKAQGLVWLVDSVWPRVRERNPTARLLLAGQGSERFARPEHGIEGLGEIDDDVRFLGRGAVFVNPQQAGSGIKLKSIGALAAGKILVTTENGARGLGGEHGTTYLVGRTTEDLARWILEALGAGTRSEGFRTAGRALTERRFSRSALEQVALPLAKDFRAT